MVGRALYGYTTLEGINMDYTFPAMLGNTLAVQAAVSDPESYLVSYLISYIDHNPVRETAVFHICKAYTGPWDTRSSDSRPAWAHEPQPRPSPV